MSILSTNLALKPFPDYELLDSGDGMKLERFGNITIARPESQALWSPRENNWNWDAFFDKSTGGQGKWMKLPEGIRDWSMSYEDLTWQCRFAPYRHVGVFPEQAEHWRWMRETIQKEKGKRQNDGDRTPSYERGTSEVRGLGGDYSERKTINDKQGTINVLNLFAYTGIASIACAKEGTKVTHVDASKPTIGWAQKNLELSEMPSDSIRWILDDVVKFVEREVRRGNTYDGFIMDPPVFGHGAGGEIWEFETSFPKLLGSIRKLISPNPVFFLVNTYASSIFSTTLANILADMLPDGVVEHGELGIRESHREISLTTGVYARWRQN